MENIKMTEKQVEVAKLLVQHNEKEGVNVYEFIKAHKQALEKVGVSTDKINSANATLASLASKELASKSKLVYNDKMATYYKATDKLKNLLKSLKESK